MSVITSDGCWHVGSRVVVASKTVTRFCDECGGSLEMDRCADIVRSGPRTGLRCSIGALDGFLCSSHRRLSDRRLNRDVAP